MEDKKTILVVDDTPENIDILVGILGATYTVKAALNGEKAVKRANKQPPDLILLDVMMPGMDGYEVFEQLKSESSTENIPVIFVTGHSEGAEKEKGMAMGASGYLTKPIDPEKLISMLNKVLS